MAAVELGLAELDAGHLCPDGLFERRDVSLEHGLDSKAQQTHDTSNFVPLWVHRDGIPCKTAGMDPHEAASGFWCSGFPKLAARGSCRALRDRK